MKRLLPLLLLCACSGSLVDHAGITIPPDAGVVGGGGQPPTQTCLDTCLTAPAGATPHCDGNVCGYQCQPGLLKTPLTTPPSCSVPTAVAAGGDHTCAIAAGQVLCWGDNGLKQLGVEGVAASGTPLQLPGLPAAADKITASTTQTCAHFADGAVWCWGAGQAPHAIAGITGTVNAVAAGAAHACAATDTAVWCWGDNSLGQLGEAPGAGHGVPEPVGNVPGAKVLAAGNNHTCAGDTAGSQLWCWGDNGAGQNGTGATTPSPSLPAIVQGAGGFFVAAGENHTCSATSTGSLSCWGANGTHQIDGSTTDVTRPKGELSSTTGAAGGAGHTCAIENGGAAVSCWGHNDKGQLGTSDFSDRTNPFRIPSLADIDRITAGSKHTCVLTKAATLLCWGFNESGQLGTGTVSGASSTPQPVTGL